MNSKNQKQAICEFFLKNGYCKFGNNCRKSHDIPKMNNQSRNEIMPFRANNVPKKKFQNQNDLIPSNEFNKREPLGRQSSPWPMQDSKSQKSRYSLIKNNIKEEKFPIKKDLCDNFRKGQCIVQNCKRLHQYSFNNDLKLMGSDPLAQNNQENSYSLVEVEFPVFAVGFMHRILIFDANNSSQKLEIPIQGELSCLKVQGKLLVAAYTDKNSKGHLLIIPVQKGFETKIDIPDCHQNRITSISFLENKILTASLDGYLKLWDENKEKKEIFAIAYGMATVGISTIIQVEEADQKTTIIAGCVDGTLQFFEWIKPTPGIIPQFNRYSVLQAHKSAIMAMVPCDGLLYSGGFDSNICITSLASLKIPKIVTYLKVSAQISMMRLLKKSNRMLLGFSTGLVQIYEISGLSEETWFHLHKNPITDILCLENRDMFFVLDYNGYVSSWQITDEESIAKNLSAIPVEMKGLESMDINMNAP